MDSGVGKPQVLQVIELQESLKEIEKYDYTLVWKSELSWKWNE